MIHLRNIKRSGNSCRVSNKMKLSSFLPILAAANEHQSEKTEGDRANYPLQKTVVKRSKSSTEVLQSSQTDFVSSIAFALGGLTPTGSTSPNLYATVMAMVVSQASTLIGTTCSLAQRTGLTPTV